MVLSKSHKKTFFRAILTFIILSSVYMLFFVSKDALNFIKKVEEAFNQTDNNYILISDVTDFDWDTVCYFPQYNFLPLFISPPYSNKRREAFESFFKVDYEPLKHKELLYLIPSFSAAYFFIKDSRVVHDISYTSLALRYRNGSIHGLYEKVNIKDKNFYFINEISAKSDFCLSKDNAAFEKHFYNQNSNGSILITNLNKEEK